MVSAINAPAAAYLPPPDQSSPVSIQSPPLAAAPGGVGAVLATSSAPISDSTLATLVANQSQDAMPANLRGQDLRNIDLKSLVLRGADLSGADLSGMDLSGLDLRGAQLDGAKLAGAKLTNTQLDGVSARRADFSDASLINTSFNGADFSQAKFDRAFIGKEPPGDISIVTVDRMLIAKDVKLDGASFTDAEFQLVGFSNTKAAGADFSRAVANSLMFGGGSDLTGASFNGLTGRDVRFGGSNLTGAAFTSTKVSHAEFTATTMDGVRFAGSSLNGKRFNLTDLRQSDFAGVVREGRYASFNVANLDGLDFSGFDFTGAQFVGSANSYEGPIRPPAGSAASMNGTSFAGAKFDHATFQEIQTVGADFTGAGFKRVQSKGAFGLMGRDGVVDGWTNGWSRAEYEEQSALRFKVLGAPGQQARPGDSALLGSPEAATAELAPMGVDDLQGPPQDKAAQAALATLKAINDDLRQAQEMARDRRPGGPVEPPQRQPGLIFELIA